MPDSGPTRAPSAESRGAPTPTWAALFGPHWRALTVAGACLVWALGAAVSLADPDLGMHLRVGEWIVAHGTWPHTEPFAWTRAGAPYFAYSWLAETSYYALWRAGGPWALQALNGVVLLAGALAVAWFARLARYSAWTAVMLVVVHALVVELYAGALRPQGLLAVVLPLCWAAAARLRVPNEEGGRGVWWPYALLAGATAVAANTHLFAPACAASLALLVPARGARGGWRRLAGAGAAVAAGLLCTPYALEWAAVYRLNFAPNLLLRYPSPIAELTPGVVDLTREFTGAWLVVPALALLPWLAPRRLPGRALVPPVIPAALLWLAGLLLFALASRGGYVWWLLCLPLVGATLARVPAPSNGMVGRVLRAAPLVFFGVWAAGNARDTLKEVRSGEGGSPRWLPNDAARGAFLLADSLDRLAPGGRGRVATTFNYGNALLWRLPRYSMSLDGRAIFPDSAVALEHWVIGAARADTLRAPLAGAELALLPARHTGLVQAARTPGWELLARVRPPRGVGGDTAELWARADWLRRYGVRPGLGP